jgi:hypothetical protein
MVLKALSALLRKGMARTVVHGGKTYFAGTRG